jgi:hypothetical protein
VYGNAAPDLEEILNEDGELWLQGSQALGQGRACRIGNYGRRGGGVDPLWGRKNYALLKEAAINLFAANPAAVMPSSGWKQIEESLPLVKELMEVLVGNKNRPARPVDSDEKDYKRLSVSTLRLKLDEMGLDVDGSKMILISRLEQEENDDGSGNSSHGDNATS